MHLTYGPFTSAVAATIVLGAAADKNNRPGDVGVCWMESGNIQLLRPPGVQVDGSKSVMIFRYDGLVPRNPASPNAPDYFPRFSAYARRSAAWQQDQARDWRYEVKDYDAVMAWKKQHAVVWNVGMAAIDVAAMWIGAGEFFEALEAIRKAKPIIGVVKPIMGFGGPGLQFLADGVDAVSFSVSRKAGESWEDTFYYEVTNSILPVILGLMSVNELVKLPAKIAQISKRLEDFQNGIAIDYGEFTAIYFDWKNGAPLAAGKTWWNLDSHLKEAEAKLTHLDRSLLWLRKWLPGFDYFGFGVNAANMDDILGSFSSLGHLIFGQSGNQSGSQVSPSSGFHQITISTVTVSNNGAR